MNIHIYFYAIPSNTNLDDMAQIPLRNCGFCKNAIATLFCEGCHQTLCVDCKQNVHDKVPIFQDHEVVNIHKEGNRVFRSIPVCEIHKLSFRYYCNKCDCLTCEECMTSTHNEHRTEKIKHIADARRQGVNQIIDTLKTKVEINKNKLKIIEEEHYPQITEQCQSYVSKVEETAGELHNIVDRNTLIYKTTASDFNEIEKQESNKRQSFFQRLHEDSADRILKFNNLMQEKNDIIFIVEMKNLHSDIEVINEETEHPLNGPKHMDGFVKSKFTRAVIEEIDEQVIKSLQENEKRVNDLQQENDRLRHELEFKQKEIGQLSNEVHTNADLTKKLTIKFEDRIRELERKLAETKKENKSKLQRESDHERESDFKQPTSFFLRQWRPIKPKDTFQSIDTSFPAFSDCVICMDTPEDPRKLNCGHIFCQDCIGQHFKLNNPVCPTCGSIQGEITGNQPPGTMKVYRLPSCLSGYPLCGRIVIEYDIPGGYQGKEHKTPGRLYEGIKRSGYLPDNEKGQLVAKMLRIAFDRKLVFTIGDSRTTGKQGVVTWNDIHHKTNPNPHGQFGYPDETYLDRVIDEMSAKGVTEKDVGPDTELY